MRENKPARQQENESEYQVNGCEAKRNKFTTAQMEKLHELKEIEFQKFGQIYCTFDVFKVSRTKKTHTHKAPFVMH